jgi:hypothetical protein
MLRYRRNDGFLIHSLDNVPEAIYVHPETGVRQLDNFITPDFRRSDLIIFSRAPLPLPDVKSANGEAVSQLLHGPWSGEQKAMELLQLVVKLTKGNWLPEMMRSLYHSRVLWNFNSLTVWRGGWRIQQECVGSDKDNGTTWDSPGDGLPPLSHAPSLQELLFKDAADAKGDLVDIDTLFYNLQTVLHNHLLRRFILPHVGIPFLDLETLMSVWRSGLVGSASFDPSKDGSKASLPGSRNCLLPCLPSAGMSVEEAFIGGLHRVLNWGWDKNPSQWTGPTARVLRMRDGYDDSHLKKNQDAKVGKARSGADKENEA